MEKFGLMNRLADLILAYNNENVAVVSDGSLSSDGVDDALTYLWLDNGVPIGTGPLITNDLSMGTHETIRVIDAYEPCGCWRSRE